MHQKPSFEQIEEIFLAALEIEPERRSEFIRQACAQDEALRLEVESLLAHEGKDVSRFAVAAVGGVAAALPGANSPEPQEERAGPYRLMRQLGAGGMGAVWLGVRDDDEFRHEVAVKFLRHSLQSEYTLRRFRHERQILAGLHHPNIAALYDGGTTTDGRPYIVMEYVQGPPVTDYCRDRRLSLADRIRLFRKICAAVQHAHRNLIVHRDLKPSNILVNEDGEPKLLDFGIAKLLDPSAGEMDLTQTSMRLLTPEYASPEQVRAEPVTTATDVYALGLILYELLTGKRAQAVKTNSELELHKAICESLPDKPSTAARRASANPETATLPAASPGTLAGDLDNIVLMALRKEPERRYPSVEQFSDDLARYLEGRPVSARDDSFRYRAGKFLRRNALVSAITAVAVLSAIAGVIATLRQAERAERRFAQVRRLANTFLFDFHDRIQNLPGSTETRAFVVNTALTYLDSLAAEANNDPGLLRELADAYVKIGDVQGLQGSANLGRPKDAHVSYAKALSIATQIQRTNPGPSTLVLLSRIHLRQGMTESAIGDTARMIDLHRQAVDLARRAAEQGGGAEARLQWIASLSQFGQQLISQAKLSEAIDQLRTAVSVEAQESKPDDAVGAYRIGLSHSTLASALKMKGDHEGALDELAVAQRLGEKAAALSPQDTRPQMLLMNIHKELGDTVSSPFSPIEPDWPRCVREFSAMHKIAAQLLEKDPKNQVAAFNVFFSLMCVAEAQGYIDPAQGIKTNERARELHQQYEAIHSGNLFSERALMNLHLTNAGLNYALGRYKEVAQDATRSLEILETMHQRDPKRFLLVRDRINVLTWRAKGLLKQGRLAEAEADLSICRTMTPQLPPWKTRNRDIRECADCFETSGYVARARKAGRAAEQEYFGKALEHWRIMKARGQQSTHIDMRIARLENLLRESGGAR